MKDVRVRYLEGASQDLSNLFPPPEGESHVDAMQLIIERAAPFLVPGGGRILDDNLKGLPETLKLPFENIAILLPKQDNVGRRIVLATQNNVATYDLTIYVLWENIKGITGWLPTTGFLAVDSSNFYKFLKEGDASSLLFGTLDNENSAEDSELIENVLMAALRIVCELLEALSCSNVSYKKNPRAITKDKKRPLMYDEFYTLMVDSGGSGNNSGTNNLCAASGSPGRHVREHLCRGHIRNQPYKDGVIKKIWINAVVKGAGNGGGKISKVYNMKGAK